MLEWTGADTGTRLMSSCFTTMRAEAYGPANGLPDTKVGTFSRGLMDEAKKKAGPSRHERRLEEDLSGGR